MEATFDVIKALENHYQVATYAKVPIALERGAGSYVYDIEGRRYLDFYGGHAVTLTGHNHPAVVEAITSQAEKLLFYSNVVYSQIRAELVHALVSLAPSTLSKAFLCNSGAEANEAAIKLALRFTGKKSLIAFENGFHGRTVGALSVTGIERYRKHSMISSAVHFLPFGNLDLIESRLRDSHKDIAAVILEPIQSIAGVMLADEKFYRGLRSVCDETETILIFDEVQTGLGRTGAHFFGDHCGIVPDIITLAKGIASGLPMGAALFRDTLADTVTEGELGSTFGGGQVVCAAALATLKIILGEGLAANAATMGERITASIQRLSHPALKCIRGKGLLLGIEFKQKVKPLITALRNNGVLVGSALDEHIIRLLPPLTVSASECDEFIRALELSLKEI